MWPQGFKLMGWSHFLVSLLCECVQGRQLNTFWVFPTFVVTTDFVFFLMILYGILILLNTDLFCRWPFSWIYKRGFTFLSVALKHYDFLSSPVAPPSSLPPFLPFLPHLSGFCLILVLATWALSTWLAWDMWRQPSSTPTHVIQCSAMLLHMQLVAWATA